MCYFRAQIAHLPWTKLFGTNHCYYSGHAPSLQRGGGGKNFRKVFAGESEIFILEWGVILLGGWGGVEGRVTLKKKLKLHKTSIKSILGITNLIYFRDNASAKFCILPMPFSWNSRVWSFFSSILRIERIFLGRFLHSVNEKQAIADKKNRKVWW